MWPFQRAKKAAPAEVEAPASQDSMRCATANVLKEIHWGEGGVDIKKGTKHFKGGAKVYLIDYYPGMCEGVVVIGHHRASGRYIELSMRAKHLENFRIAPVYSPKVIRLIRERYSKDDCHYSEELAQRICDAAQSWAEMERQRSLRAQTGPAS